MKNLSFNELDKQLAEKIRVTRQQKEEQILNLQLKKQLLILLNEKGLNLKF